MLPATITDIHQAFREIKHMRDEGWEDCRLPALEGFKEVIETSM